MLVKGEAYGTWHMVRLRLKLTGLDSLKSIESYRKFVTVNTLMILLKTE